MYYCLHIGVESLAVSISKVYPTSFPYTIPSFPVITVKLQKVDYVNNGQKYVGFVQAKGLLDISCGKYICHSFCNITLDGESYVVLWDLCKDTHRDVSVPVNIAAENDLPDEPHTLPFKVLGSCYHVSRQETLGEAYEFLNDYNRPVFVKLEKVPDNKHDKNAIGVFLMTRDEYVLVGYIASELTKYLHPLMDKKQLDIDVKHIRFCTTYLRMGFYLTIDITKHGMWPDEVVKASKKVA